MALGATVLNFAANTAQAEAGLESMRKIVVKYHEKQEQKQEKLGV